MGCVSTRFQKQTRILHNSVPKGSILYCHPNIYFPALTVTSVQYKVELVIMRVYLKYVFIYKYKYF